MAPCTDPTCTFTAWEMQAAKLQGLSHYEQRKADNALEEAKRFLKLSQVHHTASVQAAARAGMIIKENTDGRT